MTHDEFLDWSDRHSRIFGVNFDSDLETVAAWEPEFHRLGYTAAELQAATTAMAALTEQVRLSGQLAWINEFIRRLRNRNGRSMKRREPDQEFAYDRQWFRQEIERRCPGIKWTVQIGKPRKAVKK